MATLYSTQYDRMVTGKRVKSNEIGGRGRFAFWSMPIPVNAIADVIYLTRLPVGARILDGREAHTALSSGAGASSVAIGTPADLSKYLATTSVDAAGVNPIANTIALGMGIEVVAGSTEVVAEVQVEAWLVGGFFRGWIEYMLD